METTDVIQPSQTVAKKIFSGSEQIVGTRWKERADKLFTPEDAVRVWKTLLRYQIVPQAGDLSFLSPASHVPSLETAIFRYECSRRTGRVNFITGDISDIDPNPALITVSDLLDKTHEFEFHNWDASNLEKYIKPGTMDVVWDRKGYLWYLGMEYDSESSIYGHGKKNLSWGKVISALEQYRRFLKPGGSVVIDCYKIDTIDLLSFAGEESTVQMLNFMRESNDEQSDTIWKEIRKNFTVRDYGKERWGVRVLTLKRTNTVSSA